MGNGRKGWLHCTCTVAMTSQNVLFSSAAKIRFGQVGSHYDRERQANHRISTQAEGNPVSTHLKYKNRIIYHQMILSGVWSDLVTMWKYMRVVACMVTDCYDNRLLYLCYHFYCHRRHTYSDVCLTPTVMIWTGCGSMFLALLRWRVPFRPRIYWRWCHAAEIRVGGACAQPAFFVYSKQRVLAKTMKNKCA